MLVDGIRLTQRLRVKQALNLEYYRYSIINLLLYCPGSPLDRYVHTATVAIAYKYNILLIIRLVGLFIIPIYALNHQAEIYFIVFK